jgi:hypothetical protein
MGRTLERTHNMDHMLERPHNMELTNMDMGMGSMMQQMDSIFNAHSALSQGFGLGDRDPFGGLMGRGSLFGNMMERHQNMFKQADAMLNDPHAAGNGKPGFVQMHSSSYVMTRGPDGKPKASYTSSGRSVETVNNNGQHYTRAAGYRHAANSNQASASQRHYIDSRGTEGMSYKKALGDRSREVWVHRKNGKEDKLDNVNGMNQDALPDFDREWSQKMRDGPRIPSHLRLDGGRSSARGLPRGGSFRPNAGLGLDQFEPRASRNPTGSYPGHASMQRR